ncbi:MAG: hypothetical protein SXV54_25465 [Chloroflexota bacterium]|nr:hypothetical protein [Chloroflexota bacterium]
MTRKSIALCMTLGVLALLAVVTAQAGPLAQRLDPQSSVGPQAALGTGFTYQGRLDSDGEPVAGNCEMAFRLYDDGAAGSQVGSAITTTVPITDGLFTVNLDFGSGAFDGEARWLGISVNCPGDSSYSDLGRQALTAVPYALYAARSGGPENVVTVAKSGGDYTSVQAAVDSIGDAAADNAYLVWIAPGVYSETVTLKPHVHLQGAGQTATVITSTVSNETSPIIQGTLVLTTSTSLRDLTVGNSGVLTYNAALLALDDTTQTLVADVTVLARGNSASGNQAIYLTGPGTGATLLDVTALAENDSGSNYGLYIDQGVRVTVRGGSYTACGGGRAWGIHNYGYNKSSHLTAENVTALGENGSDNSGLFNFGGVATLHGGSFTARGGTLVRALQNYSNGEMTAQDVVVLGENSSDDNWGLYNSDNVVAVVLGGTFTARGGENAAGIYNGGNNTELQAQGVIAVGEDGTNNHGLYNCWAATAVLRDGYFTGRGGSIARGIRNDNSNTELDAENVTALAEDGTTNHGLHNDNGATAILRGGSFIARGGNTTRGVYTESDNSYLEAERVTIRGEDGASSNHGLESSVGADTDVTQSVLEGADVSAVTSGGGGPVTLSNSRLIGGIAQGNVSCIAVSRGTTFNASGCP